MGVDDYLDLVAERAEVIETLVEGPTSPGEVADSTDASRSTVNRAIRALEDAGLVERTSGGYAATPVGRLALDHYRAYRRTGADLQSVGPALAPLPTDAPVEVDAVAGADVTTGDDATPYRPAERLHETVADADVYRAVLPALDDPRHVGLLYEHVVTDDDPADLVVSEGLLDRLHEEFPRRLSQMVETADLSVAVGDTPPFGLVLTDHGGDRRASLLVFADSGGLHAVVENERDRALAWADATLDRVAADAESVTDRFRQSADGGVVAADETDSRDADGLLVDLEREGFVRLSRDFFAEQRVADPTTAWRAGLDLAEVHTGYAVERTDDGTTLAATLCDRLAAGEHCALVGPPGAGKSTACKRVACRWYDESRGPVLYREWGRGQPFESVGALVGTVAAADGHALVVVEDAVRPDAAAVFEALAALADRDDVSVLLDARETEWRDPPTAVEPAGDLAVVTMPRLDDDAVERVVDHFERTVGTTVDVPTERIREAIRDEARGPAVVGCEVVLLLHRLARYADPLADDQSTLEAEVAATYDDLAAAGDAAVDVAVLATLLSAAGVDLAPGYLHAIGPACEYDADSVAAAIEAFDGRVLFGRADDGTYRTVHETWAVAFLAHLLDVEGADSARERVGRVGSGLLALADDPRLRERVAQAAEGSAVVGRVATEPARWVTETVERLFRLGRDYPKLALLLGDGETSSLDLPAACPPETGTRCRVWLGEAFLAGGDYDRAERAFDGLDPSGGFGVERLLGLSDAAREQGEYDRAADLAEACLDRATDRDRERAAARARAKLGRVALARGEYGTAADALDRACEQFETLGDRRRVAGCLDALGQVARNRSDYERAREYHERSLAVSRDLGDRQGVAMSRKHLGTVAYYRGEYDRAREQYQRSLDVAQARGDRQAEANRLNNLANVAADRGDYDRAREYHERSLAIKRDLGDREGLASSLNNLGTVAFYQEDFERARDYYERSLAIKRDLGDRAGEASSLTNLGAVARERGDYERARAYLEESLEIRRDLGDRGGVGRTLNNLSDVERALGDDDRARECAERSVDIHRDLDSTRGEAYGREALGQVYERAGEYDRAREEFETALDLLTEVGDRRGVATVRGELGSVAAATGDDDRAHEQASQALEIYDDIGDDHGRAACRATLGVVARDRGALQAAREYLTSALETFERTGTATDELDVLESLVELELAAGDDEAAREYCRRARDRVEDADRDRDDWRERVRDLEDRTDGEHA